MTNVRTTLYVGTEHCGPIPADVLGRVARITGGYSLAIVNGGWWDDGAPTPHLIVERTSRLEMIGSSSDVSVCVGIVTTWAKDQGESCVLSWTDRGLSYLHQ